MLNAAKAMKLSAKDLLELEIIDEIIDEPLGGAHRDKNLVLENVRKALLKNLMHFNEMKPEEIFENRKNKFLRIGRNKGFIENIEDLSSLTPIQNNFAKLIEQNKNTFIALAFISISILLVSLFL